MFDKKILMPHQYFYPHMDLIQDRCSGDASGIIEKIRNYNGKRKAMIYIHIPYCDSKCNFCGFDKQYNYETMDMYTDRLIQELEMYSSDIFEIESVHFGGGTPTLLNGDQLRRILGCIRKNYDLTDDMCVHMEGSCTSLYREDIIRFILEEKIARVSTGIQTFHRPLRDIFAQKATLEEVYLTLTTLKKNNIIVHGDILYGYPQFPEIGDETEAVLSDVREAIRMGLDGIDFSPVFPYSNNLERMMKECGAAVPSTEKMLLMMNKGKELMTATGYAHETCYCFVKRGKIIMESNYYGGINEMPDCIAVGSGSLGNVCGFKYRNHAFNRYMNCEFPGYLQLKELTDSEVENMRIIGWPKLFSLSKDLLTERSYEQIRPAMELLISKGLVIEKEDSFVMSEDAKYYADNIYFMMLPEKERKVVEEQLKILVYESENVNCNENILWNSGNWRR